MSRPPFDFGRFVWRRSSEDPSTWVREGAGVEVLEDFWQRLNNLDHVLFLGVQVSLQKPFPADALLERARAAWSSLRLKIPTIAATTAMDAGGHTLLVYRGLKDAEQVLAWASRTIRLVDGSPDLDDWRSEVGLTPIPDENGDQMFIHVICRSDSEYDFLLHTSHVPFDAAGIKTLMAEFFTLLALELSGLHTASESAGKWGEETNNLLPAASEVLGPDEPRRGDVYDQSMNTILSEIADTASHMHGFRPRPFALGPTRRISHTFSEKDSSRLLQACRARGFTVNQVAHAALFYVCVLDNPPTESTPENTVLTCNLLRDCRDRLAAPYNGPRGYPGYALGASAVHIPISAAVAQPGEGQYEVLIRMSCMLKAQYTRQKSTPSLLGVVVEAVELMLQAQAASGQPPARWTGPLFSGDGVGEKHLAPEYYGADGTLAITLGDFFISLNKTDPGPFFRIFTWRGQTTLSADTNVNAMPVDEVREFVKRWEELLRLFMDTADGDMKS